MIRCGFCIFVVLKDLLMASNTERRAIQIWPRKYYMSATEEHREAIRLHNYRSYFLKCIEKQTPEVVEHLASKIRPLYEKEFWADCDKYGYAINVKFDNHVKYHDRCSYSWFLGTHDFWWDHYGTVRDPLLAWARQYRLSAEWVLKMALDAMLEWTWHHTHFEKFEYVPPRSVVEGRARKISPDWRSAFLREARAHEEKVRNAIVSWPVRPFTPINSLFPTELESFKYPKWDGHDEKTYERAIRELFDAHLKQYLVEIGEIAKRATVVKPLTKLERFDMLALHLCRDKKLEEIAAMAIGVVHKVKSGVSKDIKEAAKLVKIPLKGPGIARGTKLQRWPR
jgi:hypothetical protein